MGGAGGQRRAQAALPQESYLVPMLQEGEWGPRPVCPGSEQLFPTWIRSPDRPARSKSLYRLRYPGPRLPRKYIKSQEGGYLPHRLQLIIRY